MSVGPEMEQVFHDVADMDAGSRLRYFEQHTVDPAVRAQVEALLACDRTATHELSELVRQQVGVTVDGAYEIQAGMQCGPYRLQQRIGTGGMGEVWLAERTDGLVKRSVAIKLPLSGIQAWEFAQRTHRERDILAGLAHPGVARLYDAGLADGGRPFLVLEYIEGVALDKYCDECKLSIRARLTMFLQVLAAVQYAHSHLVIHSDLKPSNILVTKDGEVKLLDFGIAKLIKPGEPKDADITLLSARAMTPGYAAPEQVAGERITTACDVYSLGVILFELLSGQRPFASRMSGKQAEQVAPHDVTRRPSQTASDDTRARARDTTPKRLAAALKGDLDNITLKAIQKEPSQRYGTVDAFKADIERYLAGEPVLARPESAWYRARKFVARHRAGVAVAAGVTVSLAVGFGVALREARVAKREAQTSAAVQGFIENIFETNSKQQPDPLKARQTTARELLDIGARQIDSSLNDAPAAKQRMLAILQGMYADLGLFDEAVSLAKKDVAAAKVAFGENDPRVAQTLISLGATMHSSRSVNEREGVLLEAKRILDKNGDFTSLTRASLLSFLAQNYQSTNREKSLDYAGQAVAVYRRFPPSIEFADALYQEALIDNQDGDFPGGERLLTEALSTAQKLGDEARGEIPLYASALGEANEALLHYGAAEEHLRLAWNTARSLNGDEHVDTIETESRFGRFLGNIGRFSESLQHLSHATEVCLKIKGPDDPFFTPQMHFQYGEVLYESGRLEDGLNQISMAIENRRKNRPGTQYLAQMLQSEALDLAFLGRGEEARKALEESDAILRKGGFNMGRIGFAAQITLAEYSDNAGEAKASIESGYGPLPANAQLSANLLRNLSFRAEVALLEKNSVEAERLSKQAVDAIVASSSRDYMKIWEARDSVDEGNAYLLESKPQQALPLLQRAVQLQSEMFDSSSPLLAASRTALASCYLDLGNRSEAMTLLTQVESADSAHEQLADHYRRPVQELRQRLVAGRASAAAQSATARLK